MPTPLVLLAACMGWPSPAHAGHAPEAAAPASTSPAPDDPAPAVPEPAVGTEIHHAILHVEGRPWEEVRDALALRLPHTELLPFDDASFAGLGGQPFAYVEIAIEPGPDAEVALTIVLSDQRAYLRRFAPEADRPLRSIVTTVANTLVAIEQEQIEADERVAEIPRPEPEPSEPALTEPTPALTEPTPTPAEPEPTPPATNVEPPPRPPPYELGVAGSMLTIFGLAPAPVRAFAAGGGEARVSARLRRGALVELGLRFASRGRLDHRLWRNRLSLAGGYAWRGERFGVAAVAGPTVEPWTVRRLGTPTGVSAADQTSATPLWGAMMAVTPSLRWRVAPTLALALGLRTELATGVLGSGASARVLGLDPAEPPETSPTVLFTLGGLELSTALELTVWIAPPRSS
ncbi:MAG: hypothetical protein H6712_17320 [Myxococcales bacterium]|nr:hypothetical protein [Myxococcales bacterium]